jgi:hypothetical protein
MTSNGHAVIQWWTEVHYGGRSRASNFVGGHTSGAIWSSNTIANCYNCNQPPLLAVPIVEQACQPFVIRTSVLYMSAPLHVSPPTALHGLLIYGQWTQTFQCFIMVRFSILLVVCGPSNAWSSSQTLKQISHGSLTVKSKIQAPAVATHSKTQPSSHKLSLVICRWHSFYYKKYCGLHEQRTRITGERIPTHLVQYSKVVNLWNNTNPLK